MKKLCLVVDDDTINRYTYVAMLDMLGFEAIESEDPVKALAMCEECMPDAIILDWQMPKMNGLEFLDLLRKFKNGDKPFIILCTAKDRNKKLKEESLKAGANVFLHKPLRIEVFRETLQQAKLL